MFFIADIALMLELMGFVFGLVLLYHAKKADGLVRAAGIIMIVGSIIIGIWTCMGIYKIRSHRMMEHMKHMKEKHVEQE